MTAATPATRYLVTGGAGFVGSGFVHRLLATRPEATVTVLDRLTYAGHRDNLPTDHSDRLRFVHGDVADAATVEPLVAELAEGAGESAGVLVHFAAESHNDNALADPMRFVHTNLVGTATLLELARRYDVRLHHVSTDEVYGDLALDDPGRFTEASPYRPSGPYAATKAGSDHLVRSWVRTFGVRATITCCSNNYGPRQHVEKLVPRLITNLIDDVRPRLYGDGRHVRDWIHVDDHTDAVLRVLEAGEVGATYLVGGGQERSNLELARTLLRIFGRDEDDLDLVADRPGHDRRYAVDSSRLRDGLGWSPRVGDLETGLAETVRWYREHEGWWRPAKAAAEAAFAARGQ